MTRRGHAGEVLHRELLDPAPSARELRARQAVLAAGELDTWRAKFDRYHTTRDECQCPDFQVRGVGRHEIEACKHMLALRLLEDREVAP